MKEVKRIVVVGGGTAGWITASWFSRRWGNLIDVTVIDKYEPERVGVGEATLLSFPGVMQKMGFKVEDWMNRIDATFKAGILFPGWGKEDSIIWHPFGFTSVGENKVPLYDIWTNYQDKYDIKDISPLYQSAMNNSIEIDYIADTYAYQIDCGKLVRFLHDNCTKWCNYIQSDVKTVIKIEDDIEKIILEDGSEITGDLFIDCTGWNQLLIGKDHNIDLSDRLFIDSALAARVKYEDPKKEMHPYTDCQAMEHGWRWKIPTRSRIGTGYCFNRSITHPDIVAQQFSEHWNGRIKPDDMRLLDWKPQYNEKFWNGNVVSIGLSAGFIEPLESTGLALMIRGCEYLEEAIYGCFYNPKYAVDMYNTRMKASFETAVDYVNMHYSYCQRKGRFWDYVRLSHYKSGMQKYMEEQILNPNIRVFQSDTQSSFFGGTNWQAWLLQLMPEIPKKNYWYPETVDIISRFDKYIETLDNNVKNATPQRTLLKEWYG